MKLTRPHVLIAARPKWQARAWQARAWRSRGWRARARRAAAALAAARLAASALATVGAGPAAAAANLLTNPGQCHRVRAQLVRRGQFLR